MQRIKQATKLLMAAKVLGLCENIPMYRSERVDQAIERYLDNKQHIKAILNNEYNWTQEEVCSYIQHLLEGRFWQMIIKGYSLETEKEVDTWQCDKLETYRCPANMGYNQMAALTYVQWMEIAFRNTPEDNWQLVKELCNKLL